MSVDVARAGGPVACAGLAWLLVAPTARQRFAAIVTMLAGILLLGIGLAPAHDVPRLAGAVAVGVAIAAALAAAFRRYPWAVPFLALASVPARIPVHVGDHGSKLLLPLYVVCAGALAALVWDTVRGDSHVRELGPLAVPLGAFVAWTGLTLAWSEDVHAGAVELLAYYLPLGVLAIAVARVPWRRVELGALQVELVAMALVFAVVGFYQYRTRDVFQNPKVITSNAYASFFRVNSVFWDPSVYGRFLVVALIAGMVLVVRGRSWRNAVLSAVAVVVTWLGLLISFSQSSFAALMVALVALAAAVWRWRALAAVGLTAVVLLSVGFSAPQVRHTLLKRTSAGWNNATSDRASLVANGIRIAVHHPATGVGVGGFKKAYAQRVGLKGRNPKKAASHDTPVTVAAESGVVGFGLFVWFVASALLAAVRRIDRTLVGRTALVLALVLAAIFVHSLSYNAFFEDPVTWGVFGLIGLVASQSRVREEVRA